MTGPPPERAESSKEVRAKNYKYHNNKEYHKESWKKQLVQYSNQTWSVRFAYTCSRSKPGRISLRASVRRGLQSRVSTRTTSMCCHWALTEGTAVWFSPRFMPHRANWCELRARTKPRFSTKRPPIAAQSWCGRSLERPWPCGNLARG